jgi:hypothetical protein
MALARRPSPLRMVGRTMPYALVPRKGLSTLPGDARQQDAEPADLPSICIAPSGYG